MIGTMNKLTGLDVCKEYLGLHEKQDRVTLMKLFQGRAIKGDIAIDPSNTPWCAAMVNFCERKAGNPGTTKDPLAARSFKNYGIAVDPVSMKEGDILVFPRANNPELGHVCYLESVNSDGTITVIGGNQHDSVSKEVRSKAGLIAVRRYA